ncbi:ATP-binding protein [Alteribacillus bidgolensis]|uniref:histidine kinase n=1 Tax=Alteribacillus bidgolensis TaxID=930129 RepID=A0A1G8BZK3_9BACI|nr:ATP-binding protein [Alteribacillus bidgolensis]SDH38558.1 two-component system, OmpR family, sensor histidine kinase ResE [Alteribacillus bidgolensis]
MLWRSVVGKLWITILLLVLVVLLILTVLLLQFFERFHITEAEEQLTNHANVIVSVLEEYDNPSEALNTVEKIADSYDTTVVVFQNGEEWESSNPETKIHLPLSLFKEDERLSLDSADESVITHGDFPVYENGEEIHNEIFVVGMPFETTDGEAGSLYLYQSLSIIEDTTGETKQIILLSAGIAIILTTVFAFFLSTRITAPLRKMRELALEVAKGNFETKVPILTNDEIGQLGNAFNKMRRELNQNITALNQEKEQLSRILSSMADGVITMDRKGTIVVTNPPADRFLQSYQYEHYHELNNEKELLPKEVKKLFQRVVALEQEQMIEMDVQGRSYVVLMTPLYDKQFVRGIVAVIRDMTEERQHDKLRKDFIANVSHELRTPISMLQGYSEAIIDDIAASEEDKKEIGRIIYDESMRMGRLVNELLDLARMEAGHIQLEKQWIHIPSFSERIHKKFQGLAKEAEVELKLMQCNEFEQAYIDPDRVEQVMTNLIHNAIRHTSVHGYVKMMINNSANGITVEIKDSGSGIPEEDLPYVFERFYKADKARTRGKGGTGLGLAIAKNIVEAHSGEITVHSKLHEGTTFHFYIPREKDKE